MAILRKCRICGTEFKAKSFQVKRGKAIYCSRKCHYQDKTGENIPCHICGKESYKTPKQIRVSKNKKYFCSKACQAKWRNTLFIGPKHSNWKHGKTAYQTVLRRIGRKEICQLCGNGDTRVLATHHIDKDRTNSLPENLAWLCHNCHFLVHHYDVGREQGLLKPRSQK